MIRSISKKLTLTANAETLTQVFTTPEGKRRKITEVRFEDSTDTIFRLYLEQDRIVEVYSACNPDGSFPIPVNLDVPSGMSVTAGFVSEAGVTPTVRFTVFYEESN